MNLLSLHVLLFSSALVLCSSLCSPLSAGLGGQLSHSDSVSEHSPSIFPENVHSLSSRDQPQHLLQQSASSLPPLSHLSDQLVPDTSCKEGMPHHSGKDFEDLRLAISQLRAERQAQLQQQHLDSHAELSTLKSFIPNPVRTGGHHTTQGGPGESVQLTSGKKAVAASLELIHSRLQSELSEEEKREARGEGWRSGGSQAGGRETGDQRDGTPVRLMGSLGGNLGLSNSDTSLPPSNQNTATVTGQNNPKADQHGESVFKHDAASSGITACPVEGDRSRLVLIHTSSAWFPSVVVEKQH